MNFINILLEKRNNLLKSNNIYYLVIIFILFAIDRYSKSQVINFYQENTFFLNDFLNIDLIWNTGIGFGLFSSNSTLIYNSITLLIGLIIFILLFIAIGSKKLDKIIYSTIIGGATGNLYDRLLYNAVPDFIDLHYKNFHWFTFNFADIFITIGIIFFIMKGSFEKN